MKQVTRIFLFGTATAVWLLAVGFLVFANTVMRETEAITQSADAIVVLTGGQLRIQEGADLLKRGLGQRMLISGVNTQTGQDDVRRLSGLDAKKFDCCVDLGYTALNTVGNANETRTWAKARNFDTLIVVTSNYHMPRTLAELARVLPETRLIPHAVTPKTFTTDTWWLSPLTLRNLAAEYLKFLPSAARLAMHRFIEPAPRESIVEATHAGPQPKT